MSASDPPPALLRPRRSFGRLFARLLCGLLAFLGMMPFAAAVVVRSDPVRRWAAAETASLVKHLAGIDLGAAVRVELFPLHLVIDNLVVRASDGGSPALAARRVSVTPRLFSLLAGRLDAGEVEIEEPTVRVVLRDGKLVNVAYKLPESKGKAEPLERAPFTSLSLTDARVSLDIDGVRADAGPIDLDVFAEPGPAFEIALRAADGKVSLPRKLDGGGEALDEDVICELDTRIRLEKDSALVRRLSFMGIADVDPKPGTAGRCDAPESDGQKTLVRLSEVRVVLGDDMAPVLIDGHVVMRAPLAVANRFAPGPFRGWVSSSIDVRWDQKRELPELRGKFKGGGIGMSFAEFAKDVEGDIEIVDGEIRSKLIRATYGHSTVNIEGVSLRPTAKGVPLRIHRVEGRGLRWEDLMENIDITRDTIIQWNLDHLVVNDFGGTIDPLKLDGDVVSETTGFEVFNRSYRSPERKHMIGVKAANVRTRFGVRENQVQFMGSRANFGSSELFANVVVGFHNEISLSVGKGSRLDLGDVSPLIDIPMSGKAVVEVTMAGKASEAELTGTLSIDDLLFAGFPLGDVESSKVRFKPLVVDLTDVHGIKGTSRFIVPSARLDFDSGATLLADARVTSDRFDLRDFLSMWHFDEDPRFAEIAGRGTVDANLHYDLGGKLDQCDDGYLRVDGNLNLSTLDLFGEHYDSAATRFDYRWFDQAASHLGMSLSAPSLELRKGAGTILGSLELTEGAAVSAHLVASGIPLGRLDALGELGRGIDATTNAVAEISGTLDAMAAQVDVRLGPARIGRATLPPSELKVTLEPTVRPLKTIGKTKCGRPKTPEFDPAEYAADRSDGTFHAKGQLFGGQVTFTDLAISRQRSKTAKGVVALHGFDLGAAAELHPASAMSDSRLDGRLSAAINLEDLNMDRPGQATVSVDLNELRLARKGMRVELEKKARLVVKRGKLEASSVSIVTVVPTGERAYFDVTGGVDGIGSAPRVDLTLALRPADLGAFARLLPQTERARGTLGGAVRVTGTWPDLRQRGRFTIENGEFALANAPITLTDVDVVLDVEPDEIRIARARASVGGGTLDVRGAAPLRGMTPVSARATITARNVSLPLIEGVRSAVDADLALAWQPARGANDRALPKLTGDITLQSFRYTRKMTVAADIDSLTRRGRRTHFESYDPENDFLDIDLRIRAPRPLEIDNDLIEAKLEIDSAGLGFSGTNQRFGMRGDVDVVKGGRIKLRRNDFEITQGTVRFDDPERIAPRVDVKAVTDYHRYDDSQGAGGPAGAGAGAGAPAGGGDSSVGGGRWRITMHAHGDPETLRIDLTSEPALSQDDIFLLLTLGITRTELDRAQSATAGGSVALEALGRLTGADEAVESTIPVIDEFKLGSAYSSRTGRTEPTVTIGKRLAQRIRAYVTSGITESSEVRSNVEWRLSPRVSVESSYDNVNDISSSGFGNLGADVRWRMEFE